MYFASKIYIPLFLLVIFIVLTCFLSSDKLPGVEYLKQSSIKTEELLIHQNLKKKEEHKDEEKIVNVFGNKVDRLLNKIQLYVENLQFYKNVGKEENKKSIKENEDNCSNEFSSWFKTMKMENNNLSKNEIEAYVKLSCQKEKGKCKEENLTGPLAVRVEQVSLDWMFQNELSFTQVGGWWTPDSCQPKQHTAIIIPFRKREHQLPILLRQLIPVLLRQLLHYRVFVIEQADDYTFNRAKLMNVGYKEALRYFPYGCLVFHDVDLLPEDDRINYGCNISPKHLSVAVSTFNYRLPYLDIFGGVSSLLREDFENINGFSNRFWEWGGEDDNISFRIRNNSLKIQRQSAQICRYTMLGHASNKGNNDQHRFRYTSQSNSYVKQDGLNSLEYDVISRENKQLYTLIKVNLRKDKDKKFGTMDF